VVLASHVRRSASCVGSAIAAHSDWILWVAYVALQVMHYDLRCGTGVPDAQARTRGGSSSSQGGSRNGARRKLLACRGYSKMRGVTREVGVKRMWNP
jgi:hypothetical protein